MVMAQRAEQVSLDAGKPRRGSGYLIAPGLVVTARHLLDGLDGPAGLRVTRLTGGDLTVAEIIRPGDKALDVALLRVQSDETDETPTIAITDVDEPVEVLTTGFPRVQREAADRRPEGVRGTSAPLSGPRDMISVDVMSSAPIEEAGWSGFSGAALFTLGGVLIGVIVADHRGFGGRRLEAVPVSLLLADPRLRPALPRDWQSGSARQYLSNLLAFRMGSGQAIRVRSFAPMMTAALRESLLTSWIRPLRAEYQVVPFIGREEALAVLSGWLAGPTDRVSFAVVTGPAGSGKSRTAAELCRRAIADGWVAGPTETGSEPAGADLANLRMPVLLVQDYMDNSAEPAAKFIESAVVTDRKEPVRILFLVRSAERFLKRLRAAMQLSYLKPAEVVRLQAHELTAAERAEHYATASAAFAALRGVERPAGDRPLAAFPTPLLVHAQALADLQDGPGPAGPADPDARAYELLDQLLFREDDKVWEPALAEFTGNPDTREDCFAIATVVDAYSAGDAGRLLTLAHGLTRKVEVATGIAERMAELYADEGFLPPVQPDLLGERLVERRLLDSRKIDELFVVADAPAQRSRMLEILLRMCGSPYPTARSKAVAALERILAAHLTALVGQAIALNSAAPDPATDALPDRVAAALSVARVPAAAVEAAGIEFPLGSRMQALAAAVYEQAAQAAEEGQDQDALIELLQKATRARLFAGQPDAALPLSARMMSFTGRLPAVGRHQQLGKILGSQSLVRISVGNVEGALDSAQRAVRAIEDAIQESADPDRFAATLAESRNILAQVLMAAAEPIQAMQVLAVTIDDIDLLPRAAALETLGVRTMLAFMQGDLAGAQWASTRARELSGPGSHHYAAHTGQLALLHAMAGDGPAALRFAAEAVEAVDALPDQPAEPVRLQSATVRFQAAMAFADHDEDIATRYLGEAVDRMRRLHDEAPELYGFFYVMYSLIWAVLQPEGEVLREVSIIAGIADELFHQRPGVNWPMLPITAAVHAAALVDAERADDAPAVFDEAIAKLRRIESPVRAAVIADLLTQKVQLMFEHLEDDSAALGPAVEARRAYEVLAADEPERFLAQLVDTEIGEMLALGMSDRDEDALRAAGNAVRNAGRLVELTGGDASLRVRSQALSVRGKLLRAYDRPAEALTDFRQARADLLGVMPIDDDEDEVDELDQNIRELEEELGAGPPAGRAALPAPARVHAPEPEQASVAEHHDVPADLRLPPGHRPTAAPEAEAEPERQGQGRRRDRLRHARQRLRVDAGQPGERRPAQPPDPAPAELAQGTRQLDQGPVRTGGRRAEPAGGLGLRGPRAVVAELSVQTGGTRPARLRVRLQDGPGRPADQQGGGPPRRNRRPRPGPAGAPVHRFDPGADAQARGDGGDEGNRPDHGGHPVVHHGAGDLVRRAEADDARRGRGGRARPRRPGGHRDRAGDRRPLLRPGRGAAEPGQELADRRRAAVHDRRLWRRHDRHLRLRLHHGRGTAPAGRDRGRQHRGGTRLAVHQPGFPPDAVAAAARPRRVRPVGAGARQPAQRGGEQLGGGKAARGRGHRRRRAAGDLRRHQHRHPGRVVEAAAEAGATPADRGGQRRPTHSARHRRAGADVVRRGHRPHRRPGPARLRRAERAGRRRARHRAAGRRVLGQ
ncbi:hypothetical protein Adu01nite_28950 [Paractinoplanes durhamensis]|uniref:Serine protease n=1 Tax=Paractinoplanes durhamensis TaxID=113563 RepID=A0ABQ3YVB7_9ACTN|nr:hypothetical protein Adu01nite_28950 [Actinoplanes durhamensis]